MESFPRFDRTKLDAREKIMSLKAPFVDVFTQLKEKMAEGGFDAIVSDDTGARIPTLLFREVYEQLTGENPQALFIASGKSYYPKNETDAEKLKAYIQQGLGKAEKIVLVTQYIHEGGTVRRLVEQLHAAGYARVTVAALDAMNRENILSEDDEIVIAKAYSMAQHSMAERHPFLSGVAKSTTAYSPQPLRLDTAIEKGQLTKASLIHLEEYDDYVKQVKGTEGMSRMDAFEVVAPQIEELNKIPLSEQERKDIQKTINFTRALIQEVACDIVSELHERGVY